MRYYLVAGEASGDLHGSLLIGALKSLDPQGEFRFIGGDLMIKESGLDPFRSIHHFAFMGFLEVFKNLPTIFKNLRETETDILNFKPDALILIDFPGFNLRLAKKSHKSGIPTYYYISPKVWAWNSKRVLKIKRDIDHLLVIFPFEVKFYKQWGMEVDYVGNPLMDSIHAFEKENSGSDRVPNPGNGKPIIALLPGSRRQELEKILPVMLEIIPQFPDYEFILAGAPGFTAEDYAPYFKGQSIPVLFWETYSLLSRSVLALVTSGTATLETALLQIPEVVLYKTSVISYEIGKRVIRVPFISLVNLIMEKEVVKELIQSDCNREILAEEIRKILPGQKAREIMLSNFKELRKKVGGPGASFRAAQKIYDYLLSDGK
jgi:lipid-A-disaccharide synthase